MSNFNWKRVLIVFLFIVSIEAIITIALHLWFFLAAELSLLNTENFNYSDLIIIMMFCEVFLLIFCVLGLVLLTMKERILVILYSLMALFIVILKTFASVLYYLREENHLFSSVYQFYSENPKGIPEKYHAWEISYYNTGVSMGLEGLLVFVVFMMNYLQCKEGNLYEERGGYVEFSQYERKNDENNIYL